MDVIQKYNIAIAKKVEVEELKKIYPNLYRDRCAMPCAYSTNKEKCKELFNNFCPVHFRIENVRCTQHKEYPICRWEVDYVPENGELPEEGPGLETLVNLILGQQPECCVFLDKGLVKKESVTMIYGVICDCKSPHFEESDVQRPSHLIKEIGQLNINN